MEPQGLAQQSAMQPQVAPEMVKQVAAALMNGIAPEQLMQQGVPVEVIEMAMQMVQAQAQQQMQVPEDQAGLAGMATTGMM